MVSARKHKHMATFSRDRNLRTWIEHDLVVAQSTSYMKGTEETKLVADIWLPTGPTTTKRASKKAKRQACA